MESGISMVERVARSIYPEYEGAGEFAQRAARYSARAAIEAMRPTTNKMDVAGILHLRENPSDASGAFEAMIDAALKEQEESGK